MSTERSGNKQNGADKEMKNKVDHIGIIVRSLDESIPFYRDLLQFEVTGVERVESEEIKVAIMPCGDLNIELIEPLSGDCHAGRYLERHGEGMHHISYRVPDIFNAVSRCREAGIGTLGEDPKKGAGGKLIIFLDPKMTGRVLVELCQVTD